MKPHVTLVVIVLNIFSVIFSNFILIKKKSSSKIYRTQKIFHYMLLIIKNISII